MSNNKSVGIVLKIVAFVVSAAVGFFVTPLVIPNKSEQLTSDDAQQVQNTVSNTNKVSSTTSKNKTEQTNTTVAEQSQTTSEPAKPVVEEIVVSFDPVVNNNYKYSFNAHCNLDGKKQLQYELLESGSDKVKATNADGKFTNIDPSTNGEYRLRVRVQDDGRLSEVKIVTGFDKRPQVALKKLTAAELETMINQQKTTSRDNVKYFAKNIKIEFTNNSDGRTYSLLADLEAQLIMGIWTSVKVVSIGYNSVNQVNSVKIEIVNP